MKPNGQPAPDIDALFEDGHAIDAALTKAVRDAVLRHKRLGHPIVEWRDGRAVLTPPEQIDVEDAPQP
jgi:hypothetical protein